jgi:hypothetical protein
LLAVVARDGVEGLFGFPAQVGIRRAVPAAPTQKVSRFGQRRNSGSAAAAASVM